MFILYPYIITHRKLPIRLRYLEELGLNYRILFLFILFFENKGGLYIVYIFLILYVIVYKKFICVIPRVIYLNIVLRILPFDLNLF